MARGSGPVDRRAFAVRREVRDLLDQLLGQGTWSQAAFEAILGSLTRQRRIAVRQLVRYLLEGRVSDEVAAVEVLGRLAEGADGPFLASIVNNAEYSELVRVACGLVLLGQDRPDLIQAPDISGMVLRWQARYIAEEPALRHPLMRLYWNADRQERISWVLLQDRELTEPEGRAAVFEMLMEVEQESAIRAFLLEALTRIPGPACRAALRRIAAKDPQERDVITGSLASLAAVSDPETVPAGWSARIGFCDGTGSFPLRFDFRRPRTRPKSAVFVLNTENGVREALALAGAEVSRYDQLGADHPTVQDRPSNLMHPLPVAEAIALLLEAERADRLQCRRPPRDFSRARRLLDPLADLRPHGPEAFAVPLVPKAAFRASDLLDHPGYAGWFYDSGDRLLDPFRLEVLHNGCADGVPSEEILLRAATALAATKEPQRLSRMLGHNSLVHRAAGEQEMATVATAAAAAVASGGFCQNPLVIRMLRESLHPGHFFFSPVPDIPERADLASTIIGSRRPSKGRVLAVDLALIYSRAAEIWQSRVPSSERPHSDLIQNLVQELALAAARVLIHWGSRALTESRRRARTQFPAPVRQRLKTRLKTAFERVAFPASKSDPSHSRFLGLLLEATEALVLRFCLSNCRQHCMTDSLELGRDALRPGCFPAGPEAEAFLRTWPGLFVRRPSAVEREALVRLLNNRRPRPQGDGGLPANPTYHCPLCDEERPSSTRSAWRLYPHDGSAPKPVCRRCRNRFRRDPAFRAEIMARLGRLL